jgi:hypothetical protein
LQFDAAAKAEELELKREEMEGKMELEAFKAGNQVKQSEMKMAVDVVKGQQGQFPRGK